MERWSTFFGEQIDPMLAILKSLVEIESPSSDKAAVDRMGARVAELIKAAGGQVERFERPHHGAPILGRWPGLEDERPIFLLCHMDTVWPLGTLAARPLRRQDGLLYGPGVYDMKAGIAIALTALKGLGTLGLRPAAPVWMLCTGDEEIHSPASRDLIEALASESRVVFCLEPALPGGSLKTARKGVGTYRLLVGGRAAHAGADHAAGVNAIAEMAHQILALQALTDYERGTTVNVGWISGGSAANVVPDNCEIAVDFRVTRPEEASRIQAAIEGLRPRLAGATLTVTGGLACPPMPRDERMVATFARAGAIAARHRLTLTEGSTGGGSDANFTAAMGIATLDGLGADGDGAHSTGEYVRIDSLPERALLLAALLSEWEQVGS